MRRHLSDSERRERLEARERIVQAANRLILSRSRRHGRYTALLLSMRQVERAVFVCRQNQLVKPKVLETAGYRAKRAR